MSASKSARMRCVCVTTMRIASSTCAKRGRPTVSCATISVSAAPSAPASALAAPPPGVAALDPSAARKSGTLRCSDMTPPLARACAVDGGIVPPGRQATGGSQGDERGRSAVVDEAEGRRMAQEAGDAATLERKVARVYDLLVQMYGIPPWEPDGDALGGLVATILSQHTSDVNSARAYARLVERLPTWEQVRDAPLEVVADAIRPGGLADQKAVRIQRILREIGEQSGGELS